MEYQKRWEIVEPIGAGGQGAVHLVRKRASTDLRKRLSELINGIPEGGPFRKKDEDEFFSLIRSITGAEAFTLGALKVLKSPKDLAHPDTARSRMRAEIEAMGRVSHSNFAKILDSNQDELWYVSRYYPQKDLTKNPGFFKGRILDALLAFRPLVDAVAKLHEQRIIHRDIKPQNVFLNDERAELVLGDFGIAFFADERHERLSETLENVGTRDWMPPWAMGCRIEDVRPAFDVYTLGKLLWSMISGELFMRLWYFMDARYNLETKLGKTFETSLINKLLSKCIAEREESVLSNAGKLLALVDWTIERIRAGAAILDGKLLASCRFCGGQYKSIVDAAAGNTCSTDFGLAHAPGARVFGCSSCGHIQTFSGINVNHSVWTQVDFPFNAHD